MGIGKTQVLHVGTAIKFTEQTRLQIADGVTPALIMALKNHARSAVAEAVGLAIAGICRIAVIPANPGQRFTIGYLYGLLWRTAFTGRRHSGGASQSVQDNKGDDSGGCGAFFVFFSRQHAGKVVGQSKRGAERGHGFTG